MGPTTELVLKYWYHQGNIKKKRYSLGRLKNLEQSTLKIGTESVSGTLEKFHTLMRLSVRKDFIERFVSVTCL
jgi:hypothetical protein